MIWATDTSGNIFINLDMAARLRLNERDHYIVETIGGETLGVVDHIPGDERDRPVMVPATAGQVATVVSWRHHDPRDKAGVKHVETIPVVAWGITSGYRSFPVLAGDNRLAGSKIILHRPDGSCEVMAGAVYASQEAAISSLEEIHLRELEARRSEADI